MSNPLEEKPDISWERLWRLIEKSVSAERLKDYALHLRNRLGKCSEAELAQAVSNILEKKRCGQISYPDVGHIVTEVIRIRNPQSEEAKNGQKSQCPPVAPCGFCDGQGWIDRSPDPENPRYENCIPCTRCARGEWFLVTVYGEKHREYFEELADKRQKHVDRQHMEYLEAKSLKDAGRFENIHNALDHVRETYEDSPFTKTPSTDEHDEAKSFSEVYEF